MNRLTAAELAACMLGADIVTFSSTGKQTKLPDEKPCIECGRLKQHNNSYCSKECCEKAKTKRKVSRG